MTEVKPILQWVAISKNDSKSEALHQYDKEGNQTNIKQMLKLSEEDKLEVMIAIPVEHRIGEDNPIGNPIIVVDMRTGQFNINGTVWNFMPQDIDPSSVTFRPIWFHSIDKQYAVADDLEYIGDFITKYKVGWQFTHENQNYQRIIIYNIEKQEFSLKEKR